jgi:Nucleotidyltransferase domain
MRAVELPLPPTLPAAKRAVVARLAGDLARVPGVVAVALGGSYARGTQRPDSDVDLGVYYAAAAPFRVETIRRLAARVAAERPVVTGFYEWGRWVNGGAWIPTAAGKVDLLYRNLRQVRRVIRDVGAGRVEIDFAQQPPFGFPSVVYLAETRACIPLHDPSGVLARLKRAVAVYPRPLQRAIVRESLWSAEFTLWFARDFAAKNDLYNTAGCLTRGLSALVQVLFALNETYFIGDKGVVEALAGFARRPRVPAARIATILGRLRGGPAALGKAVSAYAALFGDVAELAGDLYASKYRRVD